MEPHGAPSAQNSSQLDYSHVPTWHGETRHSVTSPAKTLLDFRSYAVSVSGLQLAWSSSCWLNVGYIKKWGDDHLHEWDIAVERRAGGFDPTTSYCTQRFATTNRSSLFAMLASVVQAYQTDGEIPEHLATAFSRVRLLMHFDLSGDEVLLINQSENIEQHLRKRHSELDNIDAVSVWKMAITGNGPMAPLKPDSALDVFKYACTLSDRGGRPTWLVSALRGTGGQAKDVAAVLLKKEMNRKYMEQHKITTSHPHIKTYNDIHQRQRYLKGFSPLAHRGLLDLSSEMGEKGMAHGYFPLTKAVILDPCILTADAFSTQREKEEVFCCKCIGRLWLDSMGWVGSANSHLDPPPRSDA
jgi:hypothetical protein